jgi:hypothetical protein
MAFVASADRESTWLARKKPPNDCEKGGHDPAKTKGELIKYLRDSFDYANRVVAALTAKNALDRVEGLYAGPNTKLGISVVSVWHVTDHCGTTGGVSADERHRAAEAGGHEATPLLDWPVLLGDGGLPS